MMKLKASALCAVTHEEVKNNVGDLSNLIKHNQNIVIESSKDSNKIPAAVENLAYRMMEHDELLKEIICDLRMLYNSKKEDFCLSLTGKTNEEKEIIVSLFQDMYGVISTLHYCRDCNVLNGKLVISPKAQLFITGQYLEIALYKHARDILDELSRKYQKSYRLYRNVKVATKEGLLKNEFDLVIEFDGVFYVIEVKSGKNFREFDKFSQIGKEYCIVPDRLLLVDNYISAEQADTIQYFCDYYVSNLSNNSFSRKLITMIENDQ